jgi:hypothetical protein
LQTVDDKIWRLREISARKERGADEEREKSPYQGTKDSQASQVHRSLLSSTADAVILSFVLPAVALRGEQAH